MRHRLARAQIGQLTYYGRHKKTPDALTPTPSFSVTKIHFCEGASHSANFDGVP